MLLPLILIGTAFSHSFVYAVAAINFFLFSNRSPVLFRQIVDPMKTICSCRLLSFMFTSFIVWLIPHMLNSIRVCSLIGTTHYRTWHTTSGSTRHDLWK